MPIYMMNDQSSSAREGAATCATESTADHPIAPGGNAHAEGSSQKLHFLVADDNRLDRALMSAFIQSQGWTAVLVFDGATAIRCAHAEQFDGLIFDHNMPEETGLTAIEILRNTIGPNMHTPALLWTAGEIKPLVQRSTDTLNLNIVSKPLLCSSFVKWAQSTCASS